MMRRRQVAMALVMASSFCGLARFGAMASAQQAASFERQHEWDANQGVWLKIDTHIHSEFSDGSWTIESLVDEASKNGCDAIAITDHADRKLGAATEEYFAELRQARMKHPEMLIFAGVEWNIPPHGGNEHVTVVVEPTPDEAPILAEFKRRFDDFDREPHSADLAIEALRWLTDKCAATKTLAFVAYNHPSRKRDALEPFRDEFLKLREASPLVIGFEGGVGHQAGKPLGAYEGPLQLDERWDPMAAEVGGIWDQILGQGIDAWAALSTSDFHNSQPGGVFDYPPGKFSETWVYAPERSARGVLRALQAGSFFGEHGQIVRRVQLTVAADGLPRPAQAGEAIRVPAGANCRVTLRVEIPQWDWQDVANKIDVVDLIAVDANGARVLASFNEVTTAKDMSADVLAPAGGMAVRARGRRDVFQRPDCLFMTNPIRILLK